MEQARQLSLFITVFIWAVIAGAIAYAHVAFFPSYLSNLPESTILINSEFGVRDGRFWMGIHPVAILSTVITLILNWKNSKRRKFIVAASIIYLCVLIATAMYFVPELMQFASSSESTSVTAAQWKERGKTWLIASQVRGVWMYIGFVLLMVALTKSNTVNTDS